MKEPAESDAPQNSKLKIKNWIEVSAGLVFRDGKLLITKRFDDSHLGGLWEFPGGKRECKETDEECLRRELREELGIEVQVHELIQTVSHSYPEKSVCLKFFRCSLLENEPAPIGCAAIAWIDAAQLNDFRFPEADAQLLKALRESSALWKKFQSFP